MIAQAACDGEGSQVAQTSELLLHLSQKRTWEDAQTSDEPVVVDGTALVNHDLAVFPVSGDTSGKLNT